MARARGLTGISLGQLAQRLALDVPANLRRAKGWVGQLVERSLGATASSREVPDFEAIGVELKTLPVNRSGAPRESTFVASLDLADPAAMAWEGSAVRRKLARVLWVPVEADPAIAIGERRVGPPWLWSPSPEQEAALREDFEAIVELIEAGFGDRVTGHRGRCLQLRPKGADARTLRWALDEEGAPVRAAPRAFYLRAPFTRDLIRERYAAPLFR